MAPAAGAGPARDRVGAAPQLPPGTQTEGAVAGGRELQLTVALEPRDPAALEEFARAVSTPGSPDFRQYLSVGEFADRFGATPTQVAAVAGALRAQGLQVGPVTANHLTLPVSGSADAVEAAFATPLTKVALPSGRSAYANTEAPAVAASAAPYVQGVIGLDNLTPLRPSHERAGTAPGVLPTTTSAGATSADAAPSANVVTGGPQPCAAATAATHPSGYIGYTADQIASAYQFSNLYLAGDVGAGQTVALVEFEPYAPTDITSYQACYGTHSSVTNVDIAGGPGPYAGSDGEAALDIEQIIGLAPGAAIKVYEAPNTGSAGIEVLTAIVSQNAAKTISDSWAACEQAAGLPVITAENTLLQEAATQGQSFYASSGDSGSEACSRINAAETFLSVEDPSSQPFATGVGGSSLSATGPPPSERLWNDGPYIEGGATGGGISAAWQMPSYQSTAAAGLGVLNAKTSGAPCASTNPCREVPDVSADGDPNTGYVIFAEGEWQVIGGTSAAAPLWAAMTTLVNSYPTCRGHSIGFANPSLYVIGGAAYSTSFHDVSAASPLGYATNDSLTKGKQPYPVTTGYDMTTGIGTPIAPSLTLSLCAIASPVYSVAVSPPASAKGFVGRPLKVAVPATDSGNQPLVFNVAGLPAGLTMNASTGVITGTPTAPGKAAIVVSATDQFTNTGSTSFTLTIVRQKLKVLHPKLKGVAKGRPKLSFIVSAVGKRNRFTALNVKLPSGLTLAHSGRALARGISIASTHRGRFHAKAKKGTLKLKFSSAQSKVKVTLQRPALGAKKKFVGKVKHHKVKRVPLKLAAKTGKRTVSALVHIRVH
jgi:subtilase family serine protease